MNALPQAFGWSEQYAVNIAALDLQHQSLFATVDQLNEALAAGEGAEVTDSVLAKLLRYADIHFKAEEALLEQHQFPGLYEHKVEHKKFTEQVVRLLARFKRNDPGVPGALMCFMESWLKQHVMKTDMEYSSHLTERGVR